MLSSNLCCRFETLPHCEKKCVSDGDAILLVAKKRTNQVWHTSKWQLSDTRCSMALWYRKELFSHLQAWAKRSLIVLHNCVNQYGSALTARVTCRQVRRAKQKNCRKIAENCDKLREIAENCEIAGNCGKLRTSMPPPPCR